MERYFVFFNMKRWAVLCLTVIMLLGLATGVEVNAKEKAPVYKIMVNRAANCVTVYEKDADGVFSIPVKAFVCSCGKEGHETPLGTYKTSNYDGGWFLWAVRCPLLQGNHVPLRSLLYKKRRKYGVGAV